MNNLTTPAFHIKENSWLAAIAAWKLGKSRVAMVLGKTIHLHQTSQADFLANEAWFRHELCHVAQFQRYGMVNFLLRYVWESIRKGYYYNKYEVEARQAETS